MSDAWPELSPDPELPLFQRLARGVAEDIRRGRYRPGDRLPGSRRMAEALGIHRNTVLAALDELCAEGWLVAEPARGVFVAPDLPLADPVAPTGLPDQVGFDLPEDPGWALPPTRSRGVIQMSGGLPDIRLVPTEELARATRRALRARGRLLLDYGDPQGLPALRAALASFLSERRGLALEPEDVAVTRGSQMALYLAACALLRPGDRVAVETLGYPPAWRALRAAGATLLPIPVDEDGMQVDALLRLDPPPRAVYLTPHHQFPTGAVLSAPRRLRLLDWAARQRVAILEDDFDHEIHYRGPPVLPLAHADRAGVVLYVGTLSKTFAPGVRTGMLVGPRPFLRRATALRALIDRQGDHATEAALAELLTDGTLPRHLRKVVRVYARRRETLLAELERQLPGVLAPAAQSGGLALWARLNSPVDPGEWARAAERRGVRFSVGAEYALDGAPLPFVRLGFACLNEEEIADAVRRMAAAWRPASAAN